MFPQSHIYKNKFSRINFKLQEIVMDKRAHVPVRHRLLTKF